jgi:Kef-type K+ transport system membrane component KefB
MEGPLHGFLADMAIAIVVSSAIGVLFHILRQPVIVGYLLAGIVIGPNIGPQLISDPGNMDMISETGIVLLLFFVGLEMNMGSLMKSGRVIGLPALGQFPISFAIGIPFFLVTGYSVGIIQSAYMSAACALSSTAIVLKSLYEQKQVDSLNGRVSTGVLVLQDLWALLMLAVLPEISNGGAANAAIVIGKTAALFCIALFLSRFVLKFMFAKLTPYPEMTVTASIGWCTAMSALAGASGLSHALGALAAGFSISIFPYSVFVKDKMEPLRDFFLMLFFVALGLKIPMPDASLMADVLIVGAFLVVSRFIAVYPLVRLAGGGGRTGFVSSVSLSQMSEFSLILMSAGLAAGQIAGRQMSVLLYVMTFTAILSSYAARYSHPAYTFFSRLLGGKPEAEEKTAVKKKYPVIVLGFHRGSQYFIEMLAKRAPSLLDSVCVIDYNIEAKNKMAAMGVASHLGDFTRVEVLESAGVSHARVIIATIPSMLIKGAVISTLVKQCRVLAPEASIIASADFRSQIDEMKSAGADKIILPYLGAGDQCVTEVMDIMKGDRPEREKPEVKGSDD